MVIIGEVVVLSAVTIDSNIVEVTVLMKYIKLDLGFKTGTNKHTNKHDLKLVTNV